MIFTRKLLPIWSPVGWAAGRVCIGHITLFVSILVILISVLCDVYQEVVANMESCWLGCWKGLLLGWLQHREDCDLLKTNNIYIYSITFLFRRNDALNTFYLWLYGVTHMVKDHSDSKRGNPLPPHGLLFPISCKGSFICTIPQTG